MSIQKFKKIYIEITNVCNLSCDFCPKTKRAAEFMTQELFEKILFELKSRGKFLYFHVLGEPLLHPALGSYLDLCQKSDYKVNITTNGTLINKVSDLLLSKPALRQVNFSLHSFNANEHGFSVDNYLDDIFTFIHKSKEDTNIKICLRLWNLSENATSESNKYILERIEKEFSLNYKLEEKLSPCNGIKLSENIFLNQSQSFNWPDIALPAEANQKGFCYGLRDQVAILVDGTIVPCCLDGEGVIDLGNIKHNSFSEVIEGKRAKKIYDAFSNRKVIEQLCNTCDYRKRFNL
jgi:radical SAM protein with 4Fe4S-binding SPASM domain